MRVVDVHTGGPHALEVVLHPRLTVLTGDRAECSELAEALARSFTLAGNGIEGTVEYSGFHMPLDQTTVVSLDLPGDGFRVITPTEVPQPDHVSAQEAVGDLEGRRSGWEKRLGAATSQIEGLRPRAEATAAAVEVGTAELAAAREACSELVARAEDAAGNPRKLAERMEAAQRDLSAADAGVALAGELAPTLAAAFDPEGPAIRDVRIGTEPARHREMLDRAAGAGILGEARIAELNGWLDDVTAGSAPQNAALAGLLEETELLEQRWAQISSVGVEDEPQVVEARERVDVLSARLAALEELADSGILADRARLQIDAAHNERARVEGERHLRSGGVEAAIEQEHQVLRTYGFDSYLDYTIALSTRSVGDAVSATLDRVRTEQVGASDALEAMRGAAADTRTAMSDERSALRERIRERSGLEPEALTVEVLAGVPEIPPSLHMLAEEIDAGLTACDHRRSEMLAGLEKLEGEQSSGADLPERLMAEAEEHGARAAAIQPLVEQAAEEHARVAEQIAEAARVVDEATERLAAIQRQKASLEMPAGEGYGAADVAAIVTGLTPLLDPPGPDPVPVLMVDTFAPMGSLATQALEATLVAAVRVQLVYVTDDPAVVDWADRLSSSAGQLVTLGRATWFQRRLARRTSRRARNAATEGQSIDT